MAGSGSWKVAYADFVTALMAFFLLLWIITQVPEEKKAELSVYFMDPSAYVPNVQIQTIETPPSNAQDDIGRLSSIELNHLAIHHFLNELLHQDIVEDKTKLNASPEGVLLRTSNALTFAENAVELGPEGQQVLNAVIEVMRRFKVHVLVSGHTDNIENGQPRLRNKWELSAARAAFATSYIVERGHVDPTHITSSSYANYKPIIPSSATEAAPANRRVEFFFYTPESAPEGIVNKP
ncbi:flagellar motor protein MotB [Desulfovibrio sp. OttesenSCG-928-F07]|nr:flagellar motor protein MotB [Desulfovibrio sp. OttesenSCG-928-F07]